MRQDIIMVKVCHASVLAYMLLHHHNHHSRLLVGYQPLNLLSRIFSLIYVMLQFLLLVYRPTMQILVGFNHVPSSSPVPKPWQL